MKSSTRENKQMAFKIKLLLNRGNCKGKSDCRFKGLKAGYRQ